MAEQMAARAFLPRPEDSHNADASTKTPIFYLFILPSLDAVRSHRPPSQSCRRRFFARTIDGDPSVSPTTRARDPPLNACSFTSPQHRVFPRSSILLCTIFHPHHHNATATNPPDPSAKTKTPRSIRCISQKTLPLPSPPQATRCPDRARARPQTRRRNLRNT